MNNTNYRQIIDLIKYPIITDKATRLLELNQYTFATDLRANKDQIKSAIEYLFKVKVSAVNTYHAPVKKKRIGKFFENWIHENYFEILFSQFFLHPNLRENINARKKRSHN